MSNAGQTCVGVERVYVAQSAYHAFLDKLGQRVARCGPVTTRRPRTGR